MITPKEEEAILLRIEYGFYKKDVRKYLEGRLTEKEAAKKIRQQCICIAGIKKRCRETLEDLPEEYFLPDPVPFECLGGPMVRDPPEPEKPETVERYKLEGYKQADIFDYIDDNGDISWT